MKKLLMLVLALSLCCGPALAAGDLESYTLWEKLEQQALKSGLAASAMLTVEGEGTLIDQLKPYDGVQVQLRAWPTDEKAVKQYDFHYKLYTGTSTDPRNVTQIWSTGKTMYMQSELLMNTCYSLPVRGDVITSLLSGDPVSNPVFYSLAVSLATVPAEIWQGQWEPRLAPLRQQLEFWLDTQPNTAAAESLNGETVMRIRYEISPDSLRQEMKDLLRQALSDQELVSLMQGLVRGEPQQVYFSTGYLWYYERLIDSLPIDASTVLERVTSMRGEQRAAYATLPLAGSPFGIDTVYLAEENGGLSVSVTGDTFSVQWTRTSETQEENGFTRRGTLRYTPEDGQGISAAYQLRRVAATAVDENSIETENVNLELLISNDLTHMADAGQGQSRYLDFPPIQLRLRSQLSSKRGDSNGKTDYEVLAGAALENGTVMLRLRAESFALTETENLSGAGAIDLSRKTAAERMEVFSDWLTNALLSVGSFPTAEPVDIATPAPDDSVTLTDLDADAPEQLPAAEPVNEPTATPGRGGGLVKIGGNE